MRDRTRNEEVTDISVVKDVRVRFTEADPLGVVWHGHYIQYFEDAREEFGRQHGISYLHQKDAGWATPIVKSVCDYKRPLVFGDVAKVRATFMNTPAAKMIFIYEVLNSKDEVVCSGKTIQVFLELGASMSLTAPKFFTDWKEKMGLIRG